MVDDSKKKTDKPKRKYTKRQPKPEVKHLKVRGPVRGIASIDEIPDLPESVDASPYVAKNTPFSLLQQLKNKYPKISLRHLGRLVGISQEAVRQQFLRHGVDFDTGKPVAVNIYREHRGDVLASKQISALGALTDKKLKDASARDLAIVFGTLYDKERLERGEATVIQESPEERMRRLLASSPEPIVIDQECSNPEQIGGSDRDDDTTD